MLGVVHKAAFVLVRAKRQIISSYLNFGFPRSPPSCRLLCWLHAFLKRLCAELKAGANGVRENDLIFGDRWIFSVCRNPYGASFFTLLL
jgi:hypothetical protein